MEHRSSAEKPQIKERPNSHRVRLEKRFPGRIREDAECFIYDLTDSNGNRIEAHTPKWTHIPLKIDDTTVLRIPVWDVIETELEHRHEYGRDDFSLADALRKSGRLRR